MKTSKYLIILISLFTLIFTFTAENVSAKTTKHTYNNYNNTKVVKKTVKKVTKKVSPQELEQQKQEERDRDFCLEAYYSWDHQSSPDDLSLICGNIWKKETELNNKRLEDYMKTHQ